MVRDNCCGEPLKRLCSYVEQVQFSHLPDEVVNYTRLLIADHIISAVAGYNYNRQFNDALIEVLTQEVGEGRSTFLFHSKGLPAATAAFLNAVYCHGADIDDGHREAEAHPGVAVIAAALALAEEIQSSGEEAVTAVLVGYEVFIRVAKSVLPSHLSRGFHTTGTVGAIAAAAACAKLLGLDAAGIERAVSLAATQASGLLIVCESGQMTKPINPGRAAQAGVQSARLASKGIDAPVRIFDSAKGFAHAFSDSYHPEALTEALGTRFMILDVYVKLYPSCRHTHATIEALKKCVRECVDLKGSRRIIVYTYPIAVDIVGHNRSPKTTGDVKFSIPYTAACVAMYGDYTLSNIAEFEEQREDVIRFIEKIEVISEPLYDNVPSGIRGAKVIVQGKDGVEYSSFVDIARGEGNDRIDWAELKEKAMACCGGILTSAQIDEMMEYSHTIDRKTIFRHFDLVL